MSRTSLKWLTSIGVAVLIVTCGAPAAWAQSNSGVTGRVTDNSDAVLPGVTISADCECLGASRVAVTDGQGRFNIALLPVGVYTVTMSLQGFSTLATEAVELTANFTATVNGVLAVGALQETVTVSGAAPLVDIVNVQTQRRQDMDILESLPSGGRDVTALVVMTLGATNSNANRNDVGGAMAGLNSGISIHGSEGNQGLMNYDGMNTNVMYQEGGGQNRVWKFNTIMVGEYTINAGGAGANTASGGATLNMIPRDGSNAFSFNSNFTDATTSFASGAIPDSVKERSGGTLDNVNNVKRVWDYGVGAGGAIVRDRVWYYAGARAWGGRSFGADNHENSSPVYYRYEADLDNPAFTDLWQYDFATRVTFQASERNRFSTSLNRQRGCGCGLALALTSVLSPDAATDYQYGQGSPKSDGRDGMYNWIVGWTSPVTNSLLLDAGMNVLWQSVNFSNDIPWEVGRYSAIDIAHPDKGGTFVWGSESIGGEGASYGRVHSNDQTTQRASLSFVTGSHNLEIGGQALQADYDIKGGLDNNPLQFIFAGGGPVTIIQHAVPMQTDIRVRSFGLYAQEQWTLNRLTLNLGVRYDYFHSKALEITQGPGAPFQLQAGPGVGPVYDYAPFVTGSTTYPALDEIPKYHDIVPRIGVAYDLRGDGRTAITASWGKYVMGLGGGPARDRAPAYNMFANTNRLWFDNAFILPFVGQFPTPLGTEVIGDFIPQCDFTNSAANGECGATAIPLETLRTRRSLDPWDSNTGWNVREFSYELSVGVQHELTDGVGLTVSYHRNSWHNQQAVWNRALTADDFASGTLTAPTDSRLGDRSGASIPVFDINPASQTLADDVLTRWQDIPGSGDGPSQIFHGVDIGLNARFDNGALIQGGVTLGRRRNDSCWLNDLPQVSSGDGRDFVRGDPYCNSVSSLWNSGGSQIKFSWIYPLPWEMNMSGNVKTVPGNDLNANVLYTGADFTEALGRPHARGSATRLNAYPNGTQSDDRVNQLDLRLTKVVPVRDWRLNMSAELYNVFNARPVQGTIEDFGNTFLYPEGLLGGRFFKYVIGVVF